jgi:hypothetical protein
MNYSAEQKFSRLFLDGLPLILRSEANKDCGFHSERIAAKQKFSRPMPVAQSLP